MNECPTDSKHTMKVTDCDEHFIERTCSSCNKKTYQPVTYSELLDRETGDIVKYELSEEIQAELNEEESEELLCSELVKYYG